MKAERSKLLLMPLEMQAPVHLKQCPELLKVASVFLHLWFSPWEPCCRWLCLRHALQSWFWLEPSHWRACTLPCALLPSLAGWISEVNRRLALSPCSCLMISTVRGPAPLTVLALLPCAGNTLGCCLTCPQ